MRRGIPIRPMRILEYLRSSGEADHGALEVAEVCDDETIGRCGRIHDASAAELFGASECGFDVGDPDVEDRMMSETRSATYSAADSGTVAGLDQVQEAVFVGIGHRTQIGGRDVGSRVRVGPPSYGRGKARAIAAERLDTCRRQ